jgi:hypothetical protein
MLTTTYFWVRSSHTASHLPSTASSKRIEHIEDAVYHITVPHVWILVSSSKLIQFFNSQKCLFAALPSNLTRPMAMPCLSVPSQAEQGKSATTATIVNAQIICVTTHISQVAQIIPKSTSAVDPLAAPFPAAWTSGAILEFHTIESLCRQSHDSMCRQSQIPMPLLILPPALFVDVVVLFSLTSRTFD